MGAYAQNYLKMLHRQSIGNKARLADAKDCGCFFCLSHFPASAAEYWDDEGGQTAACPECGIDSVIGEYDDERVSDDLLRAMKERYFGCDVDSGVEYSADAGDQTAVCTDRGIDSLIAEYEVQRALDDLLKVLSERYFGCDVDTDYTADPE